MTKLMDIMRGLPGSGKSHLARSLAEIDGGVIHSTDDFFMVNGEYHWTPEFLHQAHEWNRLNALKSAFNGVPHIIIDNTNTTRKEIAPYIAIADRFGYRIAIHEPCTAWAFDAIECGMRNRHNVPIYVIEKMLARYERHLTVDDCRISA